MAYLTTANYELAARSANYSHLNDRSTQQRMPATVAEVTAKALDTNDYHSARKKEKKSLNRIVAYCVNLLLNPLIVFMTIVHVINDNRAAFARSA